MCFVQGHNLTDGLYFNEHHTFDQEIEAIAKLDLHSVIDHRQIHFRCNRESSFSKFVSQALLIDRFQKTRPQALCTFIDESMMAPLISFNSILFFLSELCALCVKNTP